MNDKVTILVIHGTSRKGNRSANAAKWVAEQGRKRTDVEILYAEPSDFTLPPDGAPEDGEDPKYKDLTAKVDAFYVVTPEYNHSFPGSLKRLFDSGWENYKHKPIATAGVSDGPWGGVRACEALLHVYHTAWMVAIKPELYFPKVQDIFNEQGSMKPEFEEMYLKNVGAAFDELVWFAKALKAAPKNS